MSEQKTTLLSWSLLILLGTIWGGAFFFARIAVVEIDPITLVFMRVSIAATAMWCFVLASKQAVPRSVGWIVRLLLLGLLNNVIPFSLIFWAQQYIPSGLASVLNAFTPIFTMLVMQVFRGEEKLTPTKLVAAVIGISGVAIMVGTDALSGATDQIIPQLAVLGAALSYALAAFLIMRLQKLPPATLATGQLSASTLLLIPALFFTAPTQQLLNASLLTWASTLVLALICTAFAYILYFQLFKLAGATKAASVTLLIPVSAIILGAVFLNERLEANHWAGMIAIFVALLLIDGRLKFSFARQTTRTEPNH
ncbi:putative amino-acid metabolite efflux pump [Pseudovibrio axinellae]|uniref:Putative amino-acid metabolite efflux pump n=1 Tax=Pseudovibrio axinellae TaxID=989403 RepID=A0A166AC96_9HYPH|nr:DMT family transporter [Pseudovibrio axinellae]KZL20860.1 putative amino-acid metabolite efflux pump [Pseudovibrio axinellae]SER20459.1 Permease of the drug/metabolite transporter (DMT) superfamily [Pseudovibrio axinellae]